MSITAMKQALDALEPFIKNAEGISPEWASERRRNSLTQDKPLTVGDFRELQVAFKALRQAIEQAEKADQEAGFEMWWGEFMPSAFRNRAWEAWSMAHPKVEQAEKQEPVGYINRGTAYHTNGKIVFSKEPCKNLETRWWSEDEPVYLNPPTAPAQQLITHEQHIALREAFAIGAADSYFEAYPTHNNDTGRMLFERGFARGFDSHERAIKGASL